MAFAFNGRTSGTIGVFNHLQASILEALQFKGDFGGKSLSSFKFFILSKSMHWECCRECHQDGDTTVLCL